MAIHGYEMGKEELLARLRKIEGQVRGLQRMVEQDRPCLDVLTQVNAASAALRAVGMGALDGRVRRSVRGGAGDGTVGDEVDELMATVARLARS